MTQAQNRLNTLGRGVVVGGGGGAHVVTLLQKSTQSS
jgi:hypothetical protein